METYPDNKNNHFKTFTIRLNFFLRAFWKTILAWVFIVTFVVIGIQYNLDNTVIGGGVVIFAIISQAFIGLLKILGLIPIVGPFIVQILALPFYWIINALGYFVSLLAIKRGYSKDVVNYRILTVILLIGIVIGFVLGKLI
ncbi:hypothetical protein KAH27_06115 [bacterium]|nr:hypothetical protein [bacterium]